MSVSHWCMLGVTMLLLLCEIAISHLCKSVITMVDGFYTFFILMRMALPFPPSANIRTTPVSSLGTHSSPQTITGGSDTADQSNLQTPSSVNSHELSSPTLSPKTQSCGLSFTASRIQSVSVFISALFLASLCIAYFLEIISFILEPHQVQHPVLLAAVGAVSVIHKMLVFALNWDQLQDERTRSSKQEEVNYKVDSGGHGESKDILPSNGQSAVQNRFHSGTLVFRNPGTSSISDTDCKSRQQPPEEEEERSGAAFNWESRSKDASKSHSYNSSMRRLDCKNAPKTSSPLIEIPAPSSKWPVCPLFFILVIRGLFTSLLALINSLVTLLITPQFPHSVLVYLDPGLSLLAVVTLIATAVPQVYRYGLMLLQASPPHICVTDLERRIASVPGVQAVHDLHVWELTESLTVASVHVHCCTGLPVHRCTDVVSGVTKVLLKAGVSCCTVQPEFASCYGSSPGSEAIVIHREDPSSPPLPACSLACEKACAGNMCCSLLENTQNELTPPTAETLEDPQTVVIENTFL